MSIATWDSEYTNHSAWTLIDETITLLSEYEPEDETEAKQFHRITLTLIALQERKESVSLFVSSRMLDTLENTVRQSVRANLDRWITNSGASHLQAAYNGIDDVLEVTRGWPPSKDYFGRGVYAAMTRFVDDSNDLLKSLSGPSGKWMVG